MLSPVIGSSVRVYFSDQQLCIDASDEARRDGFSEEVTYKLSERVDGASLVAQLVKNPPAMQESWIQSLDWEDPLEEGMAIHSSILAWRIPLTEEPGSL